MFVFTNFKMLIPHVLFQFFTLILLTDYGLERFSANQKMSEFPWIISNVTDSETGAPLGGGKVSHILEWEGRKIGVIGLVEKDWLESVSVLDMDNIDFTDFVDAASLLVDELKRKGEKYFQQNLKNISLFISGCEFVVALTHMSNESDERLAEKVPEIGIILGGHSQTYEKRKVGILISYSSTGAMHRFSVPGQWSPHREERIKLQTVFKSNFGFQGFISCRNREYRRVC